MQGLDSRRRRSALLGTTVALALALVVCTGVALLLAPAVVLFCVLMIGLRPGEQMIERLRERRRRPREHRAPRLVAPRHRIVVVARMTWLAASPLAMRPPPVAPAAIS